MINLEPTARPTFDTLLLTARGSVFPECFFSFLHNYVTTVNELPAESPFKAANSAHSTPVLPPRTANPLVVETTEEALPNDSDRRVQRIWADYESVVPYLIPDSLEETVMDVKVDYNAFVVTSKPFQDVLPVELFVPNHDSKLQTSVDGVRNAPAEGK